MHARILWLTTSISVVVTVLLLAGAVFVFRDPLIASIVAHSEAEAEPIASPATTAEPAAPIRAAETSVADMVDTVNGAVVSIVVQREVPIYERFYEEVEPFGGMFGGSVQIPQLRERGTELREVGGGSGFVVSPDGLVVTNRHVVADESAQYSAVFPDGMIRDVAVLAVDPVLDVAVLQITEAGNETFEYLTFGDSNQLRLGQTVVAIGNALAEFNNTVSVGVVSGLSRSVTAQNRMGMAEQLDQVIQTDAAINPGNSGGPMLNLAGEVVGVNVATSLQGENISFALPANAVAEIVQSIQETGEIVRPFLGVRYVMLSERMAAGNDLPVSYGAYVLPSSRTAGPAVLPDSPAAAAGLQAEDVIRAIDDRSLEDVSLAQVLRTKEVGQIVRLRVWRDGAEITTEATLVAAP